MMPHSDPTPSNEYDATPLDVAIQAIKGVTVLAFLAFMVWFCASYTPRVARWRG